MMVLTAPRFGEVRIGDLPPEVGVSEEVEVIVLRLEAPPIRVRVRVTEQLAGRGWHRCLACPACGREAMVLRAAGANLTCNRCIEHLNDERREKNTDWWNKYGGNQTDSLVRLALKQNQYAPGVLHRLGQLGVSLIAADMARSEGTLELLESALDAVREMRP